MPRYRPPHLLALAGLILILQASTGCGIFRPSERALMEGLSGVEPEAKRDALRELEGRVTAEMREDLESVLARELDPAARALAADRLAETGDPAAAEELRLSVRTDTSPVVRRRALAALGRLPQVNLAAEIEWVLSNEAEPAVRAEAAALALKHLGRQEAEAVLLQALGDADRLVRLRASHALTKLTGMSAAPDAEAWRKRLGGADETETAG